MPLLTHPNIMIWLANSSNELARYQSGQAPFGLSCFSQDSLQYLNHLLDRLANNDEYRRADGLQYANKEDRQVALQEMQQSLGKNYTQKAHVLVKNLTSDQALQGASVYRRLSQPLQLTEWWQKKRHKASATEQDDITVLQQQWQAIMPFAFCTSGDLLEKVSLLKELDAYLWLAKYHFKQAQTRLPVPFRKHYSQWLAQFSQEIVHVKSAIVDAMLGVLRAIATTGDLTCDTMINTEVIPVLKHLGILMPKTSELSLPGSFNAVQFAGLVKFIQAQGTGDQQKALAKLLLFKPRFDDKLPLASIPTLSGHFITVPTLLREHFTPPQSPLSWLPHSLRWDRQLQEECFGMETTYQIIALNQQLQHIEQQLTLPKERSLATQINALQQMSDAEKQLNDEIVRTRAARPRGLKALIFSSTCHMMDEWAVHLHEQRVALLAQKITLAEQMVQTLEEALTGTRVNLTPSLFKSVQTLFEALPRQLSTFSGANISKLKQRFKKAHEHYQLVAQFSQHFLRRVQRPDTFLLKSHRVAHWIVLEFDRQQVHEWVQAYSALVSPDEANAMQLMGQIITGEAYPSWQVIKETLRPLFHHNANPGEALRQFMNIFLRRMVLPCIKRIQDPAYQFVQALAPALAKQWVIEHRTQLESAIQIVQHVFNVESSQEIVLDGTYPPLWIQEETVTLTEDKVIESIQHICALSTLEQDHTAALLTAAQHYLEHSSQHAGYAGDNLTYHRLISAIALASGNDSLVVAYGSRRFRHLLTQHRYEGIMQDPFLQEHDNNSKLKQALQAELDHILAEPLGDDSIGLLPVIQQWGLETQAQRYTEQRDQYYLKKFTHLLSEASSAVVDIEACLQHLKGLNEPFPQSALGHYQLQALFCETADEMWQPGKQHLVTVFGDRLSQQSYRLVWLKTLLLQPSLSQSCLEAFDFHQPYANWIAVLGENHVAAVHAILDQFLDHYDHSHPLGLEVVKNILSSEWLSHHKAQDLMNKLEAIEQVCQRQVQLKELTGVIQQQLTKGDYTGVASQLNFLLKQQAYCKDKDIERYPQSQKVYRAALSALTGWLRQAVFAAPNTLAWVEAIILPLLPEGEEKAVLTQLCESAENSRFVYDRLFLALREIASNPNEGGLTMEVRHLDYLAHWPLEKQEILTKQIDITVSQLAENHPLRAKLFALQRLLLGTSTDKEADHQLLVQDTQQTTPSLASYQALRTDFEQQCMALLRTIEKGKSWESNELTELALYSHMARGLPESQLFVKALENTLAKVLKRVLTLLATPSTWIQLPKAKLEQRGQQITDDCEVLRKLAKAEHVQSLDKTVNRWLLAYCRLFVPLPSQSALPQVMYTAALYEQVLSHCGNPSQQMQITTLSQLRTHQEMIELNQACAFALQKVAPKPKLKSTAQSAPFLKAMSCTLQQLVTSPLPQKPLITFETLSNNKVISSSHEEPSVSQRHH